MDKEHIEEYYEYVIEQLEFVSMITSIFGAKGQVSTKKVDKCKEIVKEVAENINKL